MQTRTQTARVLKDRTVLRLGDADHYGFLQDLVSNDLEGLENGLVYTALLTPQGKYLFDFFVAREGEGLLVDVATPRAAALAQRLGMYRLRAKVSIEATDLEVAQVFGSPLEVPLIFADPRHAALGWRIYGPQLADSLAGITPATEDDWMRLRIEHMIPETEIELIADDTYILEAGFEALHGVDFRKGCYVGQEVTARMKHKTELKKGLAQVEIEGSAPPSGTAILAEGKPAGTLFTAFEGAGLAHLRFDRATKPMTAGEARIKLRERAS